MSEHAKAKVKRFNDLLDEITVLTTKMETSAEGDENSFPNDTPENREKLTKMLTDGEELRKSIEQDKAIHGLKIFLSEPANESKAYPRGGDGVISQPFERIKSVGEQFVENEAYKAI